MRKNSSPLALMIVPLIVVFTFCSCTKRMKNENGIEGVSHVLMIGVDGLSPDGIKKAHTPAIDSLVAFGAFTFFARGVMPTSSGPNWASILMGAGPEEHGVTSNSFDPNEPSLPPVAGGKGKNGLFPSIFEVIREQKNDWESGAIYHWGTIRNYFEEEHLNHFENPENDRAVATSVIKYLNEKRPAYCFVHFDEVDAAGHSFGHGSDAYYHAVEKADTLIGEILISLQKNGMAGETLVMVTADHGGLGFGHNENVPEVIGIPLILSGPGVKKGYRIQMPVSAIDNSPTAAFALGIERPNVWVGQPIKTAFVGYDEEVSYARRTFYRQPRVKPSGDGFKPSGGLYIGDETTVVIENTAADATIRYTLNGSEPTGASPVYKTPLKVRQTTTVKAALFIENKKVSNTNTAFFRLVEDPVDKGITGTFFYGKNLNKLPDFNLLKPVGEKVHGFEFSSEGLDYPKGGDQVAVKFVSYLNVENPGKYTFFTESDDGSKLYINGKAVVDNDGNHGVRPREGTVFLESGKHKVEVTWYNSGGGLWLQTYVEGPGFHRQVLTSDMPNASLSLHTTN